MATNTGFDKIDFFEVNKLRGVAHKYMSVFDRRVFDDGKDKDNKRFKSYSESYKKRLNSDFRKKDGGRYKGFEGMSITTGGTKLSKRMPELRGITRVGLKIGKTGKDFFQLQFTGEAGFLADALADKGRDFISDIPSKEKDYILKELGKLVDKEFDKIPNVINLR